MTKRTRIPMWIFLIVTGMSFSIGWGIRGQFGHEYGAMLAGALGGMTVALLSGREDWRRRVAYFAFFGAVGIGFGGSMSYMKVQSYAHSSDPASVLYGFACVFVVGFLWAAPAGTGLALPAYLSREELTKSIVPISVAFSVWALQAFVVSFFRETYGATAKFAFFAGYDMAAILTGLVALFFVLVMRGYKGVATSLMLYMALGWLGGHLLFVNALHLHMSPPRDDIWGSCLGMVLGIYACCWRNRWGGIGFVTVSVGFLGGMGFSLGTAVKILVMRSGFEANWHSVMEQTQGLFLGLAIALTFARILKRAPEVTDASRVRRWTEVLCVVFVVWLVPYLNFRLSPEEWVGEVKDLQWKLYGISIASKLLPERGFIGWLDMAALFAVAAFIGLLVLHLRRPLAVIPPTWLGKGQMMYGIFLWSITAINFMLVIPRFTPLRLVTEWFMVLNATFCTFVMLWGCSLPITDTEVVGEEGSYGVDIRRMLLVGVAGAIIVPVLGFGIKLACWGNRPANVRNTVAIRFGPNNTNTIR